MHALRNPKSWTGAVLALLMVLSTVAAPAEAHGHEVNTWSLGVRHLEAAGELQLLNDHAGVPNTGAPSVFKIRVQNPYGTEATGKNENTEIRQFLVVFNSVTYPGLTFSAANSRAKADANKADWIAADTQDCDGPDLPQPTPSPCRGVVFSAPAGKNLVPGGTIEIEVEATLSAATPVCGKLDINVVGVGPINDPATGFPRNTGIGLFSGYRFTLVADDLSEAVALPDFSYYTDEDRDGHLDHAYIQFNKELDDLTLDLGLWSMGTSSRPYTPLAVEVINPRHWDGGAAPPPVGGNATYCPERSMVRVTLEEEPLFDTGPDSAGNMPQMKYRRKSISARDDPRMMQVMTSLAGVRVASANLFPMDRADPVLVSATIPTIDVDLRKNRDVFVRFSEPVGFVSTGCTIGSPALAPLTVERLSANPSSSGLVLPFDPADGRLGTNKGGTPALTGAASTMWLWFDPGPGSSSSNPYIPGGGLEWRYVSPNFEAEGPSNVIKDNARAHRLVPGQNICDAVGNPAVRPAETEDQVPIGPPAITAVETDIGKDWIKVHFNTGVYLLNAEVAAEDPQQVFDIVNGRTGPTGIVGVTKGLDRKGAQYLVLKANTPALPLDVSGQPTGLRLLGNQLAVFGTENRTSTGWPFIVQEDNLTDVTLPRIVHALSRDVDRNGEVDAYDLVFSEPVDDLSFVQGNCGQTPVVLCIQDHLGYERFDEVQGQGFNDHLMTIRFQPIAQDLGYRTGRLPQFSGLRENSTVLEWRGLVKDLSINPFTETGNWMDNITRDTVRELDRARPRIMRAETLDRDGNGRLDAYKLTISEPVRDASFNKAHWTVRAVGALPYTYSVTGLLAGGATNTWDLLPNDPIVVLTFDERPVDATAPVGDTGIKPELTYLAPDGEGLEDMATLPATLGGPNRLVPADPGDVVEEDDARPVLMAALGCQGTHLLHIVFSEGVVGQDNVSSPSRAVRSEDLVYQDRSGGGASGFVGDSVAHVQGQPGITIDAGGNVIQQSDYGADTVSIVENPLNVQNSTGFVREIDGTLFTNLKQVALSPARDILPPTAINDLRVDNRATTAAVVEMLFTVPDDPGCLDRGVVGYQIRFANRTFENNGFNNQTAPDPNFVQYVWFDATRERNFTDTPEKLLEEHGVGAGQTLRARVVGLAPLTEYYFAVKPVDRAGNVGPISNVVTVRTKEDPTPPGPLDNVTITSPTHPKGVPTKEPLPQFQWTQVPDPESLFVWYHYALSRTRTYEVDPLQDPKILNNTIAFNETLVSLFSNRAQTGLAPLHWYDPPATWYFHLAACSGGGCVPLDEYEIKIDSPVNKTQMRDASRKLETRVTYDEAADDLIVEWTVPAGSDPCPPDGVQIWRRDEGESEYELQATFGSNDATYRESRWVDPDGEATRESLYAVTLMCRPQVFTYWDGTQIRGFQGDAAGRYPDGMRPTPQDIEGTSATVQEAPFAAPLWVWLVLGLLALLLIAGIVMFFMRRGAQTELWDEADLEAEESAEALAQEEAPKAAGGGAYRPPQAGAAATAAAGPKVHDVRCPKCRTQFKAEGDFPLKINCPNCGMSGTLR